MARYRLLASHVIGGVVLPAGTEIGEGTNIPFEDLPSNQMEGLDAEGKKLIDELHQRLYGRDAPVIESQEERQKRLDEQRKEEEEAEPVSKVQADERGQDWKRDEVVRPATTLPERPAPPMPETGQVPAPAAAPTPLTPAESSELRQLRDNKSLTPAQKSRLALLEARAKP